MSKGNGGDFHNGVPDKHEGLKGDTKDQVRSSAEERRAQAGELNTDKKTKTPKRGNTTQPDK